MDCIIDSICHSGLLLIVILLGYGLVAIPKSFLRDKDDVVRVNKLYSTINISSHKRSAVAVDLEDLTQVRNPRLLYFRIFYRSETNTAITNN
jgi:hypothetical protein